jgi:hypothetical protein
MSRDSLADLVTANQEEVMPGPVEWAMARWDGTLTEEAVRRVHEIELADITGYRADGFGRFRGSLLGMCMRMQMLSFLGYAQAPNSEKSLSMMNDGTQRHYWWQKVGLSAGFLLEAETKAHYEPYLFGGSLDGLMAPYEHLPGRGGFELKSTNPTKYRSTSDKGMSSEEYMQVAASGKAQLKHVIQVGGYMKALDLDWFSIVYEKRDWNIEWFEVVVMREEAEAATDAMFGQLLGFAEAEVLPAPLPDYPKNKQCVSWCDFTAICPSAEF